MFKIHVDEDKCIGCGACASTCDMFVVEGGKAKPIHESVKKVGCAKDAEEVCPVGAIKVTEE